MGKESETRRHLDNHNQKRRHTFKPSPDDKRPKKNTTKTTRKSDPSKRNGTSKDPKKTKQSKDEKRKRIFPGVAGMSRVKRELRDAIVGPLVNPSRYEKFNVSIPNGLLLYGPPGCGKTFIIQQMAKGLKLPFHQIKHSELASTYIHGTVKKIGKTFKRARKKTPAILFIDEIESLTPKRGSLSTSRAHRREEVDEFLTQLDEAGKKKLLVVGATNQPQQIDEAILRSGRLDQHLFVGPPDLRARMQLFKLYIQGQNRPCQSDVGFLKLAQKTNAYTCSDIKFIVEKASRKAVSQGLNGLTQKLLRDVIQRTTPSINEERLEQYKAFNSLQSEHQVESAKKRVGFV